MKTKDKYTSNCARNEQIPIGGYMKRTIFSLLSLVFCACITMPLFSAEKKVTPDNVLIQTKKNVKQTEDYSILTSGPHHDKNHKRTPPRRNPPPVVRRSPPPVVRRIPPPVEHYPAPYICQPYPQQNYGRTVNGTVCSVDPVTGIMVVVDVYGRTHRVSSTKSTHIYREHHRRERDGRSDGYIRIGFSDVISGDSVGITFSENGSISIDASIIRIFRN